MPSPPVGLYVHIPFCRHRCHFCAFYLEIARPDRIAAFCSALTTEMAIYGRQDILQGRPLQSVYFGGGTPTVLPADQLASLLTMIRNTWPLKSDAEITVEAHPASATSKDLTILANAGFNRISVGAESMNDQDFRSIGRVGQVRDTASVVQAARMAGLTNVNLDLMYGLPGQSLENWTDTVESALALHPSHISCYALTIEEGTKLAQDISLKRIVQPDETLQIEMESTTEQLLSQAGFTQYEISNYARPDALCRHNLLYWTNGDYLGLGPSAQSYVDGTRFGNVADLEAYTDFLNSHRLPTTDRTTLSTADQQRDALVFGLRLLQGVPFKAIEQAQRQNTIDALREKGLLGSDQNRVWLTPLGRRYADTVAEELF